MKALFKRIWDFLKRIFHIGKKVVQNELEEAVDDIEARLLAEVEELEKQLETAVGKEWEIITKKLQARYMYLADLAGKKVQEGLKELQEMRERHLKD